PIRVASWHRELHVRHPERRLAPLRSRGVAPERVPPRAGHPHVLVLDSEVELRPGELRARRLEAHLERLQVRHHAADVPAQHLRIARRKVELLLPEVDPHVLDADHDVRIAREPETLDVEGGRLDLIRDLHVDVLERHDVADVLAPPIVRLGHDGLPYPRPVVFAKVSPAGNGRGASAPLSTDDLTSPRRRPFMKAAVLYEANTPLQIVDVEQQGPQAGEAKVRVMATGICHSDWHIMNGDWQLPLPMVLGHEAAGIVEDV